MTRKWWVWWLSCVVACGSEAPPPNVLLVTVDTLRADHLGCYGYGRNTSPRLDELAQRSVLFEQALVQWPKTGPSVCSLMSSTYGSTSGVMRKTGKIPIPPEYDYLAEILQDAGYDTRAMVTNPSLSRLLNYDQGFDEYGEAFASPSLDADRVIRFTQKMLLKRRLQEPWFLWVHFMEPHALYDPPDRFIAEFDGDEVYRADTRPPVPLDPGVLGGNKTPRAFGEIEPAAYLEGFDQVRDYVVRYDAEIRFFDDEFGKFLDWMEAQEKLRNTVVVFTSDHGESLGDHDYYFQHGTYPYNACQRVPWLLALPEGAGKRVESPVGLLDLVPTLLDVLGLDPGWQFEGRSVLPFLDGAGASLTKRPVFAESGYRDQFTISVTQGRHKLIRFGDPGLAQERGGHVYELYDFLDDPGETRNLVDELPDVVSSLRELLDPYMEEAYRKTPATSSELDLGSEHSQQLEALGYVGDH